MSTSKTNWIAKELLLAFGSLILLALSCNNSEIEQPINTPIPGYPLRIEILGVSENGIFDPALVEDEAGQIWMSYSEVNLSPIAPKLLHVQTRIAVSTDRGATWEDRGLINPAQPVTLPPPYQGLPAVWVQEVSRLIFNPYALDSERWQMFWLRYLRVYDSDQDSSIPLFEHGWIAWKGAPAPEGPWSRGRKLFSGSLYNEDNNGDALGAPEYPLERLFPAALGDCLVFTEPGALVAEDGVYISLKCPTGAEGGKIVLLHCSHDLLTCDYRGNLLEDEEASSFNNRFNGFSATEMFRNSEDIFLMVTPTETEAKLYRGCYVFRIIDLENAELERIDSRPNVVLIVEGTDRSFNGACTYSQGSAVGIIYSQAFPGAPPEFRLFASGRVP